MGWQRGEKKYFSLLVHRSFLKKIQRGTYKLSPGFMPFGAGDRRLVYQTVQLKYR
jgi:hypothetical protein